MKVGLLLLNNVLTASAKSVLVPLGLTTATSQRIQLFKKNWFKNDNISNF